MDPFSYSHISHNSTHRTRESPFPAPNNQSFTHVSHTSHPSEASHLPNTVSNANSTTQSSHYEAPLEALQKPYQTMVDAVFICTAIVAFLFNCIALWLILCSNSRRCRTSSASAVASGGSGTSGRRRFCLRGPVSFTKSPKESVAQIRSNGKVCEQVLTSHHQNGQQATGSAPNKRLSSSSFHHGASHLTASQNSKHTARGSVAGELYSYAGPASSQGPGSSHGSHYQFHGRSSSTQVLHQNVLPKSVKRLRAGGSSQLNIYLVNLFINDLIVALLNVPFTYTDFMYGQWVYWPWLCPVINFISTCAVSVGIYTLIAIGFER